MIQRYFMAALLVASSSLFAAAEAMPDEVVTRYERFGALAALVAVLIFIVTKQTPTKDKLFAETLSQVTREAADAAKEIAEKTAQTAAHVVDLHHADWLLATEALKALTAQCAAHQASLNIQAQERQRGA